MDTLCVPVRNEFREDRHNGIRNMRHIYVAASAVLVLDSWILQIPSSAFLPDRYARLYQSEWIRRLWTYQEGALAKDLLYLGT